MSSLVRFTSPRLAEVVEEDLAPLGPDQVRIATLFSGISAGTELTAGRRSHGDAKDVAVGDRVWGTWGPPAAEGRSTS
jgi:hypothetical protein